MCFLTPAENREIGTQRLASLNNDEDNYTVQLERHTRGSFSRLATWRSAGDGQGSNNRRRGQKSGAMEAIGAATKAYSNLGMPLYSGRAGRSCGSLHIPVCYYPGPWKLLAFSCLQPTCDLKCEKHRSIWKCPVPN